MTYLKFFMKSGNSFVIAVGTWEIKYRGDEIESLSLSQPSESSHGRLLLSALRLGQIEAILEYKEPPQ